MEQLGQVVEVGDVPVAVEPTEYPGHDVSVGPHGGEHLGHRLVGKAARPVRQLPLQFGEVVVGGGRDPAG